MIRLILILLIICHCLACGQISSPNSKEKDPLPQSELIQDTLLAPKTSRKILTDTNKRDHSTDSSLLVKMRKSEKDTGELTTKKETASNPSKPEAISLPVEKRPKLQFEETTFSFGSIKEGEIINHIFPFKNSGSAPLSIKNTTASCGCTYPSFPFLPIKPGESGEIKVRFDSNGKIGRQKETITIYSNAGSGKQKLYLEGYVEVEVKKK